MGNNRRQAIRSFVYGEETGSEQALPTSAIVIPDYQPRVFFDERKLDEMAENIKIQGILNRLIVRRIAGMDKYELVAGGRRFQAAQRAGLKEVPVVVRKLSDEEALALAIAENLQREDLNPLEETESILRLISLRLGRDQESISALLTRMYNDSKRKSDSEQNVLFTPEGQAIQTIFRELAFMSWESFVTSRLPLLNLPNELLGVLREGKIAYTKVKAIAKLKEREHREELLAQALEKELSLSQIREQIRALQSETTELATPQKTLDLTYRRLRDAKLWRNPKKWKQLQMLFKKIESLLEEEV